MSNNEFLSSGVCFRTRRIFLFGGIEEDTVGRAIRALYAMASLDEKKPITLFLSSYGGSLDDSMGLVDVMRLMSCPVRTVAIGKCMSAAPLIIAAGEPGERYSMLNTTFMLHSVSQDTGEGCPDWIAGMADAGKDIMKRYAELLGDWTERDVTHWRRIFRMRKDRFFNAETAWDWGLIDAIFSDKEEEE